MYDMKNLVKLKLLDANAAEGMKAFWAFDKAATTEGPIPVKYKELIALGVGFTTQCPYCIEIHSNGRARRERPIKRLPRQWSSQRLCAPAAQSPTGRTP